MFDKSSRLPKSEAGYQSIRKQVGKGLGSIFRFTLTFVKPFGKLILNILARTAKDIWKGKGTAKKLSFIDKDKQSERVGPKGQNREPILFYC